MKNTPSPRREGRGQKLHRGKRRGLLHFKGDTRSDKGLLKSKSVKKGKVRGARREGGRERLPGITAP